MISFCKSNGNAVLRKEFPLQANTQQAPHHAFREDLSDYVQLHMTLQARNLVPSLNGNGDSRESMLHQTQATLEKQISRQTYLAES
jgi:hypothetical protein